MVENVPSPASLEAAAADLSLAMVQLVRRLRSEGNPTALNYSQLGTLARLGKSGPLSIAELARAEAMKPQSMGTILTGLEDEGLVQRRPHATDGRQVLFELTAKGVQARQTRREGKQQWLAAALAQLPVADQKALIALLPVLKKLADL